MLATVRHDAVCAMCMVPNCHHLATPHLKQPNEQITLDLADKSEDSILRCGLELHASGLHDSESQTYVSMSTKLSQRNP